MDSPALETLLTTDPRIGKKRLRRVGRKQTHDTNGTAGQTVDVVPDGPDQMAGVVAGQQSLQSWSLEPAEKCAISDFLPKYPLALPGEVLQMLRVRMHDVEMGRQGGENGLLRVSRQSPAELVFRLKCGPPGVKPPTVWPRFSLAAFRRP
jgi:hypothetical protein